jgi:hypothetical protein
MVTPAGSNPAGDMESQGERNPLCATNAPQNTISSAGPYNGSLHRFVKIVGLVLSIFWINEISGSIMAADSSSTWLLKKRSETQPETAQREYAREDPLAGGDLSHH